jgi:hypothetical protein
MASSENSGWKQSERLVSITALIVSVISKCANTTDLLPMRFVRGALVDRDLSVSHPWGGCMTQELPGAT